MYVSTIIYSSTIHSVVNERWTIDRLDARLGACAFARGQKSWTVRIKYITLQHKQTVECSHHLAWSFEDGRLVNAPSVTFIMKYCFAVWRSYDTGNYIFIPMCLIQTKCSLLHSHSLLGNLLASILSLYCTDNTSQRHQLQRSQFDFVLILIPLHYEINIH